MEYYQLQGTIYRIDFTGDNHVEVMREWIDNKGKFHSKWQDSAIYNDYLALVNDGAVRYFGTIPTATE